MKINQKKKAEEVGDRRGMSGESKAVNVWIEQPLDIFTIFYLFENPNINDWKSIIYNRFF